MSHLKSDRLLFYSEQIKHQVAVGGLSVKLHMPIPAPTFPHGEPVFVKLPREQLFEVATG